MSTINPFEWAIAVTGPGLHRAHWLSGEGITSSRIHAECWANEGEARRVAATLGPHNEDFTFEARRFSR